MSVSYLKLNTKTPVGRKLMWHSFYNFVVSSTLIIRLYIETEQMIIFTSHQVKGKVLIAQFKRFQIVK